MAEKKPSPTELAQENRAKLRSHLRKHQADDLAVILETCEAPLPLRCVCCGQLKVVETRCRKRWCPVCARKLAAEKVARYQSVIARMKSPLFVTLTQRSSAVAIAGIKALRKAFTKFRRTKWWNNIKVAGGVAGIEITWTNQGFHPHIHALLDCPWMAVKTPRPSRGMSADEIRTACQQSQRELSVEWGRQIGQESGVVWVKKADQNSAVEVLKYSVAPAELLGMGERAVEAIRAMTGSRLLVAWGTCYGQVKKWKEEDDPPVEMPADACCSAPTYLPEMVIKTPHWKWRKEKAVLKPPAKAQLTGRELALLERVEAERRKYHHAMKPKLTNGPSK